MNIKKALVIFVLASLTIAISGCPHKKPSTKPAPAKPHKEIPKTESPSKPLAPDSGDYFPLAARASWTYRYSECAVLDEARRKQLQGSPKKACQKYDVMAAIWEEREIDGQKVYLLCNRDERILSKDKSKTICAEKYDGNSKGFMEQGDYVYLVLIKDNHIVEKSIAGKHKLNPGDSWDRIAFLKEGQKSMKLTCAEPEMLTLPSDHPTPAVYKSICCDNAAEKGPSDKDFYIVCYAAGVGRVAEYSPNADQAAEILQAGTIK